MLVSATLNIKLFTHSSHQLPDGRRLFNLNSFKLYIYGIYAFLGAGKVQVSLPGETAVPVPIAAGYTGEASTRTAATVCCK